MARFWKSGLIVLAICTAAPANAAPWTLVGWNNLGMHCTDGDFSVFSLLPPYNTIHAQLIDPQGHLVTDATGITVTYEANADPNGSINATSQNKLNFWQYSLSLFGVALGPDQGLLGKDMPGPTNEPQAMSFDVASSWWIAEGIPLTPYDDAGQKNYYPLMHLVARDSGGAVLATTDIVLPISDEMSCKSCHASGSAPAARPGAGWTNDPNPEREMRLNIIQLHDERQAANPAYSGALSFAGYNTDGLMATVQGGTSILCARCHSSEALGGGGAPGVAPLTQSLHGLHANVEDPVTGMTLGSTLNRSACYRCHPGSDTRCLRGAMGASVAADGTLAIQCQSCHGTMSEVASPSRTGWLNEPSCQECHTGTASHNNGQIRYTSVFTTPGVPRVAVDSTFATNSDTPAPGLSLYRFSAGHGGLKCEACHGSTHAVFPSIHGNDNIQSIQRQGHSGMLSECSGCHATQPATVTGGPHGMHPIGNAWVQQHQSAAEQGGTSQCRACHGSDYRGTVLSRSQADRILATELGNKTFWRGFQIGCYACHLGPSNESRNPNRAPAVSDGSLVTFIGMPGSIGLVGTDADGNPLAFRIVSQPSHGTVGLTGTTATYFPETGFSGTDSFSFAAWDGSIDSNLGHISVNVGAVFPTLTPTGPPSSTPTPDPACGTAPRSGCRAAGKSVLFVQQHAELEGRDMLLWKWLRGQPTTQSDFADPTATAAYVFCLYDTRGAVMGMQVPPGTAWKPIKSGYRYVDPTQSAGGVKRIVLKGSDLDRSRIVVRGGGMNLPRPVLSGVTPPLVAQITNASNGICFEGRFPTESIQQNSAGHLRAKVMN